MINPLEVPFSSLLGIQRDENNRLVLPFSKQIQNHLGTFHAGAQFALMETATGDFLLTSFPELANRVLPLLRQVTVKYQRPAECDLLAVVKPCESDQTAFLGQLIKRGRAKISVPVQLEDLEGQTYAAAEFEWFVQQLETSE